MYIAERYKIQLSCGSSRYTFYHDCKDRKEVVSIADRYAKEMDEKVLSIDLLYTFPIGKK